MPDYVGSIHAELAAGLPMSIAETRAFASQSRGVLSEDDVADLKIKLAINPTAGAIMEGTGGLRKLRVAYAGAGKRSGARVIYYFHYREMPIYLLAVYKKSEKINLSDVEKAAMRKLVQQLIAENETRNAPKMIS